MLESTPGNFVESKPRGSLPIMGVTGEAPPKRDAFFKLTVYERIGKIAISISIQKGHKIGCKVEEVVAEAKYTKGCHILAEMTESERLNQNN